MDCLGFFASLSGFDSKSNTAPMKALLKQSLFGWRFTEKQLRRIFAIVGSQIDKEERIDFDCFNHLYNLCKVFNPSKCHVVKSLFSSQTNLQEFEKKKFERETTQAELTKYSEQSDSESKGSESRESSESSESSESETESSSSCDDNTTVNTFFTHPEANEVEQRNEVDTFELVEHEKEMKDKIENKQIKHSPKKPFDDTWDDNEPHTINEVFLRIVSLFPEDVCLNEHVNGNWLSLTWGKYYQESLNVAKAIVHLLSDKFISFLEMREKLIDKKISGKSLIELDYFRPIVHSCFTNLHSLSFILLSGCAMCGAVCAPLKQPSEYSIDQLKDLVKKSASNLFFVDNTLILEKLTQLKNSSTMNIVYIGTEDICGTYSALFQSVISWDSFIKTDNSQHISLLNTLQGSQTPEDLAQIVYTIDERNLYQGAMLTHRNLTSSAALFGNYFGIDSNDELMLFSLLDSRTKLDYYYHIHMRFGTTINLVPLEFVSGDLTTFVSFLRRFHPTIFFATPRFWERLRLHISNKIAEGNSKFSRAAFSAALDSVKEGVSDRPSRTVSFSSTEQDFGLAAVWLPGCHSAPIKRETYLFFAAFGLCIHFIYTTVRCGSIAASPIDSEHISTMGDVIGYGGMKNKDKMKGKTENDDVSKRICVKMKLFFDRVVSHHTFFEIGYKGDTVFNGYYKADRDSLSVFYKGYCLTGDYGTFFDPKTQKEDKLRASSKSKNEFEDLKYKQGRLLKICGRKTKMVLLATGDLLPPYPIERQIKQVPGIKHAVVVGEGQNFIAALVIIRPDAVKLPDLLRAQIDTINSGLPVSMKIKKFAIITREPPKHKFPLGTDMTFIRRKMLSSHFAKTLNRLYGNSSLEAQRELLTTSTKFEKDDRSSDSSSDETEGSDEHQRHRRHKKEHKHHHKHHHARHGRKEHRKHRLKSRVVSSSETN